MLPFSKYVSYRDVQYRTAAYAGILTQFMWGAMEILLFSAFYRSDPEAFPMGFSQLCNPIIGFSRRSLALFHDLAHGGRDISGHLQRHSGI